MKQTSYVALVISCGLLVGMQQALAACQWPLEQCDTLRGLREVAVYVNYHPLCMYPDRELLTKQLSEDVYARLHRAKIPINDKQGKYPSRGHLVVQVSVQSHFFAIPSDAAVKQLGIIGYICREQPITGNMQAHVSLKAEITIKLSQAVTLKRDVSIETSAVTWEKNASLTVTGEDTGIRSKVNDLLDAFITAYLTANP